jgi:hypothetical protein
MSDTIQVCSWNLRRLGDPHRALIVKQWVRSQVPSLDPVLNQEVSSEGSMSFLELISPRLNKFENLVYPDEKVSNEAQLFEDDTLLQDTQKVEPELQESPTVLEVVN